jgi:serine protease Do
MMSPSEGSAGIAFAIPAELAETVIKELIATGKVARGYLGANIQDVTPEIAASLGLPAKKGTLVAAVLPSGPAATGGVQVGDVVMRLDGEEVDGATQLLRRVAKAKTDQTLKLWVHRGDKQMEIEVRAGLRPAKIDETPQSKT